MSGEAGQAPFRLFARIDEIDNQEVRAGLAATSLWTRRHDKAPGTNYTAPEIEELETELGRLRGWRQRVKKYVNANGPTTAADAKPDSVASHPSSTRRS